MSSNVVIRAENLSKLYAIFASPHARLMQMLLMGKKKLYREFWALHNVSFQVQKGETVGIIGRNGSGKSTLLQLVCGTLSPTEGGVDVSGRIAALLELGTGFNPEFTGRENVYVNGALLDMSKEAIDLAFPSIAEFAAIGEFIDQPVKTYSSGMLVRLAISVAFYSNPSILIIDEALAVGDASFQRKCMRRIKELVSNGVTLLFVSHDADTVKSICDRAIYLDAGKVKAIGPAKEVCLMYERDMFGGDKDSEQSPPTPKAAFVDESLVSTSEQQYGDGACKIHAVKILDEQGVPANVFRAGAHFTISYSVDVTRKLDAPIFGIMITDKNGVCVYGVNTSKMADSDLEMLPGTNVDISFKLDNNLGPGTYYLTCGVHTSETSSGLVYHHRRMDTQIFKSLSPESQLCSGFSQLNAKIELGYS